MNIDEQTKKLDKGVIMFKNLVLSSVAVGLLSTGVMAQESVQEKGLLGGSIYVAGGTNSHKEVGINMIHTPHLSSTMSYKEINSDKRIIKSSIFYTNYLGSGQFLGFGGGLLHNEWDTFRKSSVLIPSATGGISLDIKMEDTVVINKPMFNLRYFGALPYIGEYSLDGYIADSDNFGGTVDFVIFKTQVDDFNSFMGGNDGAGLVVSVGAGFDEIQAYIEKSVYLKASYSF
jgi:hypothetical protein